MRKQFAKVIPKWLDETVWDYQEEDSGYFANQEFVYDEETKGVEREASTSQNPGHLDTLSTLTMTRIMRIKSIPMHMCLTIPRRICSTGGYGFQGTVWD